MKTITLNRREVQRIYELFLTLNENQDWGTVTLAQNQDSGIGSVLTATFVIEHKEIDGEFTVTISDEADW
jgi:hypothetical protein